MTLTRLRKGLEPGQHRYISLRCFRDQEVADRAVPGGQNVGSRETDRLSVQRWQYSTCSNITAQLPSTIKKVAYYQKWKGALMAIDKVQHTGNVISTVSQFPRRPQR